MNEIQSQTFADFSIPMKDLTPGIIELAYEEANKEIDNQVAIIQNTQRIIQTIMGWLLAAIVSLIGILAAQLTGKGDPTGECLTVAGIIALTIPACILWKGTLYRTSLNSAGAPPSYFLHPDTVAWLSTIREGQQVACKKYQQLEELQERYNKNASLMGRIRDAYRLGIMWLAIDIAIIVLILFPLVAALG